MARTIRIPVGIRTREQREKVNNMINIVVNTLIGANGKESEIERLIMHIIRINKMIQAIIWKGALLRDAQKYDVLKETLCFPTYQGLLKLAWDKEMHYRRGVKRFINEFVNWGSRKTAGASIGVSTRNGHHKFIGVPLPKTIIHLDEKSSQNNDEKPIKLMIRLEKSFPVHVLRN